MSKEVIQAVIKQVGFTSTDSKSITETTSGGICITLHNKGERPTRYSIDVSTEWKRDSIFGKSYPLHRYTLDTIINKDKERHEMLKVSYGWVSIGDKTFNRMVSDLQRLLSQDCDGIKADTKSNFVSLGMLFVTREFAESIA